MNIQPNIVTKASSVASTALTGPVVGAFLSTPQPRWNFTGQLTTDGTGAFAAYTAMSAKPTTNILYETSADCPSLLRVLPLISNIASSSFQLRVVGWSMCLDGSTERWIPTVLSQVNFSRVADSTTPNVTFGGTTYHSYSGFTIQSGFTGGAIATSVANQVMQTVYPTAPLSLVVDTIGSQLVQLTTFAPSEHVPAALWCAL